MRHARRPERPGEGAVVPGDTSPASSGRAASAAAARALQASSASARRRHHAARVEALIVDPDGARGPSAACADGLREAATAASPRTGRRERDHGEKRRHGTVHGLLGAEAIPDS